MQTYKHIQSGNLLLTIFGIAFLLSTTIFAFIPETRIIMLVTFGVFIFALLVFYKLTVTVTPEMITVIYGVGLFRKCFPVENIAAAQVVRNKWYYGWGIRLTPHGWLYNVSGLDAVELAFKNKKKVRIGTDDPQGLLVAIHAAQ